MPKRNKRNNCRPPQRKASAAQSRSRQASPQATPPPSRTQPSRTPPPRQSGGRSGYSSSAKPQTHRAVNRAMNARAAAPRRRRNRGGNYILYYLLAAIIIAVVFIVLANTVLFRCSSIEVSGTERYTDEEIIARSGLSVGDNLLHVDTDKAEDAIVAALDYIDMAQVSKVYPTRIEISVTEAEKWFAVEQDGVIANVSRGGKIIEQGSADGLTVVRGYGAESLEVGSMLSSSEDGKSGLPEAIMNAAEKAGLDCIDEIDLTNRFDITIECDGRITLEIGTTADIESKLYVAQALISTELSPTEEVTILLTDPEKAAVRSKNTQDEILPSLSDETSEALSPTEEPQTSEE